MAHNILTVNDSAPDRAGDISVSLAPYQLGGVICEVTHSASSNTAQVGDRAQILYALYVQQATDSSKFDWINADSTAIKSNSSYAMGFELKETGYFYVECVMKFDAGTSEYIVIQLVDALNNAVGPKAYYGPSTRTTIYPSTIHAVINNTTANSNYYFRVQAEGGSVGQPTTNYGSSYFKCTKL